MLIIGAKGFAKEVLEVFHQQGNSENVSFYDDVSTDLSDKLFNTFKIIKSIDAAKEQFKNQDKYFTLGVGGPETRYRLYSKFIAIGGILASSISPLAIIGNFGNKVSEGVNIMTGSIITNDITIGKGVLINLSCTIGHDSIIEDFVELCPSVNISGNCTIGSYSFIGTNAVILPKVKIGKNVTIGAGSVVTKDIPDNSLAIGIPAKVIKQLQPIEI